ncbi:FHA domain-containing protein [Zoogloea sp.]|uniref:FHA domain-containing protein n=1 Tax=Zoogloea sp. TaxID=49181 RepID=UPI0025E8FB6B|nr:FHA domain-containing protein [Zoogloea sp.]MCK6374701.1 FHA domain-containing protein [Zoogloea sp.]MCK6394843.1 FHA domain-containing protein [Zoogloea sp.]
MSERPSAACLLYADVAGGARLAVKLGEAEAGYAVERCLNRMSRCAEAYSASGLELHPDGLVARFAEADSALLAAREMRERVRALPPMSGIKLVLRAGVVLEAEAEKADERAEAMAVRLVASHNPDTISVSESFSEVLSPSMRRMLSRLEESKGTPFPTLELGDLPPPTPAELRQEAAQALKQLRVSFRGQSWVIDAAHPTLLFGRETGNDIVVADPRVSRQHARIELRSGLFYLADSSTNGTYLLEEGNAEHCIKRDEFILGEKGHIGCGFSPAENMSDAVAFAVD